jgi:uroporphyrinogen-III synthase
VKSQHRPAWRVAVVREEPDGGPLAAALRQHGLVPVACPVLSAGAADPGPLTRAAESLGEYNWVICASARGVDALGRALRAPWPASVRTAAVGSATSDALHAVGVPHAPFVAREAGAEAVWDALRSQDAWPGRRVLVLTTPGGRTALADGLRLAGADVDVVEAYRMEPRAAADIRRAWDAADADALAIGSPRAVTTLIGAVGAEVIAGLAATVAIGETTAGALRACGLAPHVPPHSSFASVAETLARLHSAGIAPGSPRAGIGRGRP